MAVTNEEDRLSKCPSVSLEPKNGKMIRIVRQMLILSCHTGSLQDSRGPRPQMLKEKHKTALTLQLSNLGEVFK